MDMLHKLKDKPWKQFFNIKGKEKLKSFLSWAICCNLTSAPTLLQFLLKLYMFFLKGHETHVKLFESQARFSLWIKRGRFVRILFHKESYKDSIIFSGWDLIYDVLTCIIATININHIIFINRVKYLK